MADQGPGRYRARWLAPGGRPQVSPAATVGQPLPLPGGAAAALRALGDDGVTPAR